MKTQLHNCCSCGSPLEITEYFCPSCETTIRGKFSGCPFCALSDEDRLFALIFIQTEGNMKDVERLMGVSYPTVKAKLAKLNAALGGELTPAVTNDHKKEFEARTRPDVTRILDKLSAGEISAEDAIRFLRGESPETVNS